MVSPDLNKWSEWSTPAHYKWHVITTTAATTTHMLQVKYEKLNVEKSV